jgi:hypothetical protein
VASSVVPDLVEAHTDNRQSGRYYAYRDRYREDKYKRQKLTVLILNTFFTGVFGALHCSAWSFFFPSITANTIWRVCSLYIAFSPVAALLMGLMGLRFDFRRTPDYVWLSVMYISGFLYIAARIILLAVAFWCLSDIPATGHRSIRWADFIPHV